MNGKDIFLGLRYVGDDLIEEAERERLSSETVEKVGQGEKCTARWTVKKPILVAALIAVMLLLTGCAALVVYLRMENLKLGTYSFPTSAVQESETATVSTPPELDVLSLQGVTGSPQYLAGKEWLDFTQCYEPQLEAEWNSEPNYWGYSVLDQKMVDKLDEICAKYDLNVIGKPWHENRDCTHFLKLAGIENLLKTDCEAGIHLPQGRFFPGGSFTVYGYLTPPNETNQIWLTYHLVKKDVFYDVFGYVDANMVTQRNYITSEGVEALLLESEQSGMILVDRDDCFLNLTVSEVNGTTLETIAEWFDFTVSATPIDAAAADARERENENSDPYKDLFIRDTYAEYIEDFFWCDSLVANDPSFDIPQRGYTFYDLDGNGEKELLIVNMDNGLICNIVTMVDGNTNDGKSYAFELCENNILVDKLYISDEVTMYHIFRFANNGDPVFSNPKEESVVRLKKDTDGSWWRTSSTDHYADFDTQITEEEAMSILNSYKRVELDIRPITKFEEP